MYQYFLEQFYTLEDVAEYLRCCKVSKVWFGSKEANIGKFFALELHVWALNYVNMSSYFTPI